MTSQTISAGTTPARRRRWLVEVGWKYPLAIVIIFFAVFPLLYVLSASLKPGGSLAGSSQLLGEELSAANVGH